MFKKALSLVLAMLLVVIALPLSAFADVGDHRYTESEPNNSMAGSNLLYSDYTVSGTLYDADMDYYKFTLSREARVVFVSTSTSSRVIAGIFDTNENCIAADEPSYSSGYYNMGLSITLSAGTYYLVFLNNARYYSTSYMYYFEYQYTTSTHTHSYTSRITAPTCTAQGYTTFTCSCGDSYTSNYVAAKGHTNGSATIENRVEATCSRAGSYDSVIRCTACGIVLSRTTTTIPKTTHTYDGKTDPSCNICGEIREIGKPTFAVNEVYCAPGNTVDVMIYTQNNPGIVSAQLLLEYDADALEIVEIKSKDFAGIATGPLDVNPVAINWVDTIHPDNDTDGVFAIVTFKVKDDAALGTTPITLNYDAENIFNAQYENVEFETKAGAIKIADYQSGDINSDGAINNKDYGLLMQYLNNWDVQIVENAADVNADASINNKDLGLLMQYLNNWDVELK